MEEMLRTVIIAHNQMEEVKRTIKILKVFSSLREEQMIVVDNASEDGLREWLGEQDRIDYIICEDEPASYAEILNEVLRQFIGNEDLLVLSPDLVPLPQCIDRLYAALKDDKQVGAVCPRIISYDAEEGSSFESAVAYAAEHAEEKHKREIMGLSHTAVLIRNEMLSKLNGFDESLLLPDSMMVDFSLRGMEDKYRFFEAQNAFFYKVSVSGNIYANMARIESDKRVLKEKWGMNYFSQHPNKAVLSLVEKDRQTEFNVLEIGCDTGVNLLHLKNQYPNVYLYGVEINSQAAGIASHIAEVQVANIEEKTLDFEGVKFDYIIFSDVLEHLRDPEGVMRYCRDLLKEDGRILACIPNLMHYSVMRDLLDGNFTYTDTGLLDRTHVHFFTFNEIRSMVERTGYRIERLECKGTVNDASASDREFVNKLLSISGEAQEFMYYTFQYLISAKSIE